MTAPKGADRLDQGTQELRQLLVGRGVLKAAESGHQCMGSLGLVDPGVHGCCLACAEGHCEQPPACLDPITGFEFDCLDQKCETGLHGQSARLVANAAACETRGDLTRRFTSPACRASSKGEPSSSNLQSAASSQAMCDFNGRRCDADSRIGKVWREAAVNWCDERSATSAS